MRVKANPAIFVLLALVLVPTLVTGHKLFIRTVYVMVALIALSFAWAWLNIRWLSGSRELRSNRSQVGGVIQERFLIGNKGPLPKLWVEMQDHSGLAGYQADRVLSSLPAHQERSWMLRARCKRRGKFNFGPVTLVSGDPLGLFQVKRDVSLTSTLVVYPATVDVPYFKAPIGRLSGGDALQRQTQQITTNVSSVRDYMPGDSFNRIHWLSTARRSRLISKEFELDPLADIWLFVDMEEGVQAGTHADELVFDSVDAPYRVRSSLPLNPSTEEYAATIAASLAKHLLSQRRALGMISYGQRREIVQVDRGERQLVRFLESLAVVRAEGCVPMAEVIAAEGNQLGGGSTLIVITPSTFGSWVGGLRDLKRKGIDVVAVHLEASTFGDAPSSLETMASLAASNIPAYLVKNGVPLEESFAQRVEVGR
ncbi:MAG: DUF58 domain-containing protein [Chloroflexi bacterium B3_Chlor]|nr:MAG: DUF58 domain-containing protein [Chloroflexi bacterium B3_Chlor]